MTLVRLETATGRKNLLEFKGLMQAARMFVPSTGNYNDTVNIFR